MRVRAFLQEWELIGKHTCLLLPFPPFGPTAQAVSLALLSSHLSPSTPQNSCSRATGEGGSFHTFVQRGAKSWVRDEKSPTQRISLHPACTIFACPCTGPQFTDYNYQPPLSPPEPISPSSCFYLKFSFCSPRPSLTLLLVEAALVPQPHTWHLF